MMDRRFLLALALSAIVIVLTESLFPTATPGRGPHGADSAAVAAAVAAANAPGHAPGEKSSTGTPGPVTPGSSNAASPRVAQQPTQQAAQQAAPQAAAPVPLAASPASANSSSSVPVAPVAAETLTVTTPRTLVSFSSVGAVPVAVTMRNYRSTVRTEADTAARPEVRLARPGESLLRYHIIMGQDTLALDRVVFQGSASQGRDGAPDVTFQGDVARATGPPAAVTIQYHFGPDGYLSQVTGAVAVPGGSVPGAAGAAIGYLLVDLPSGFPSYEADSTDDLQQLAYVIKPVHEDPSSISFSHLDPGQAELHEGPAEWAVAKDKYFLVGVLAADTVRAHQIAEMDLVGQPRVAKLATRGAATIVLPLASAAGGVAGSATFAFQLYAGPQEYRRLRSIGHDFENLNPYGGFLHPILQPFVTLVVQTVLWMRQTLQINYGWVLVIFGVVIRFLLWPVNQRAMRTSIKMQRLQPELAEVNTKYKNDRMKLQEEMVRVYREHGMSPWSPIAGCLPMMLPLPIFGALYFVFRNTIEFRGVPFLWLHDISAKDPYYIMPILMGASSFLVSWIGMRNSPPNPQTKMMGYMFPIMMTVFLAKVAAGLNLYYLVQNVATLPQQWILANERAKSGSNASSSAGPPGGSGSGSSGGSAGGKGGGGGGGAKPRPSGGATGGSVAAAAKAR
jgi:YidC/Oxa1 family membrane protein insertase